MKKICLALALAAVLAAIYEARQASLLSARNQALTLQAAPLNDELQQLRRRQDELAAQLKLTEEKNRQLSRDLADLPRLRAEVDRLRDALRKAGQLANSADSTQISAASWLDRVNALKQALKDRSTNRIPEFQFLTDEDWLEAARNHLDSDNDYRWAMATLRFFAQRHFSQILQPALAQYLQANNNQAPSDLSQLQSYITNQLDPSILPRYGVFPSAGVAGVNVGGDWIITQIAPIDYQYDSRFIYGSTGNTSAYFSNNNPLDILVPALQAYAAANGGKTPSDFNDLSPYASTPDQQAALRKILPKSP